MANTGRSVASMFGLRHMLFGVTDLYVLESQVCVVGMREMPFSVIFETVLDCNGVDCNNFMPNQRYAALV